MEKLVVSYSDLRKAIEPVADWFDLEGEEGEPFGICEAIAEISKMLSEERKECLKLRRYLGFVSEQMFELSTLCKNTIDK